MYSAGDYEYWVATPRDEPVVRDLLRRIATGGSMQLSFRREPSAFAADYSSLGHGYVLARSRRSGECVGLCERVIREAFVNGEVRALPYLAGLRVAPAFRYRLALVRGGFEAVRRLLVAPGDLPWALTSIMSDNANARRLLGANLRGMPRYDPVGEVSTFALSVGGIVSCERAREADLPELAELLMRHGARSQFAACWRPETLASFARHGWLVPDDYLLLRDAGGGIRACAALWDQSAQRQLVVAGYSAWLRRLRPVLNLGARIAGMPPLPTPGARVRVAYLSHVAADEDGALLHLLAAARSEARRRGLEVLLGGWPSTHRHAALVRQLAHRREYRSQLYVVRWPDNPAPILDAGLLAAPDLALL